MDLIIEYLISKGGIFGVLLAISIGWIVFREKSWASAQKTPDKTSNIDASLKEIESKQEQTNLKLEEISKSVELFRDLNTRQAKAAKALQEKLQTVNDERVEELKDVLNEYNKTMNELSFGLEKMNLILEMKLGEKNAN